MPVKTMARPASSAALITSSSRIEPPGWMTAVAPASAAASRPSANGKKASEATTEPLVSGSRQARGLRGLRRLPGGDARGIDPAHLAGADADRRAVLRIDDGVRLDVLGDAEGELQIGQFAARRRALGDDLQVHVVDDGVVAGLHQQAAGDGAHGEARRARIGQAAGEQQAQVLLGARRWRCASSSASGAMMTSVKILTISLAASRVEPAVQRDDAAEGRDRIAAQRLRIGLGQRRRLRRRRTGWRA